MKENYSREYKIGNHTKLEINVIKNNDPMLESEWDVHSNIPNKLMEEVDPDYLGVILSKLDNKNEEEVIKYLDHLLHEVAKLKEAEPFFYPNDFPEDRSKVQAAIRKFEIPGSIKEGVLYTSVSKPVEFYALSTYLNGARLKDPDFFSTGIKELSRGQFEKLLPVDYAEDYVEHFDKTNKYFCEEIGDKKYILLTRVDFIPIMIFCIK